jgi:hypothetical protein
VSILTWVKAEARRPDDEDFQEEMRAHLAIAADERIAEGADRTSAELASLKDFGNVTLTRMSLDAAVARGSARFPRGTRRGQIR